MYIDIHTHRKQHDGIGIQNVLLQNWPLDDFSEHDFYSVGLHPWHVDENTVSLINNLVQAAANPNCLAIGEVGLDKRYSQNKFFQLEALEMQIEIAMELQKPLIFHCVKCYNDLAAVLKKYRPIVPLIFHAFNGNLQTAKMFFPYKSYFSFGHLLLNSSTRAAQDFALLPPERIFFETDEFPISIKEIYLQAEKLSYFKLEHWQKQILLNFQHVFNRIL